MGGDGREISTWLSLGRRKKKNIQLQYISSHQDIFIAKRRVDDDMAPSPHESGSERTITTPSVSSSSSKSLDGLSSEQAKKDGDSEHAHLPQPEKDVVGTAAASPVHSPSRLVGWSGQGDQQNPQNFTVVQKVSISVVISLMNLTVSLAVSVFSAMLEVVAAEFKQDRPEKMESTLTAYILGLAFGRCLLLAPFFLSIRGKRIVG